MISRRNNLKLRLLRGVAALLVSLLAMAGTLPAEAGEKKGAGDAKYRAALNGIHLPPKATFDALLSQNPKYKKYIDWLQDNENWIDILRQIETRTGLFFPDLDIRVEILPGSSGMRKGEGGGKLAKGWLKIWLGSMQDTYTLWRTATHEVSHIYTGAASLGPMWIVEGHANYSGDIWSGVPLMGDVTSITDDIPLTSCYGRGWLFFVYVSRTYGAEAPRKFFQYRVREGMNWQASFEKATGKKWGDLAQAEYAWTRENWQKMVSEYQGWPEFKVTFGFENNEVETGLTVTKFRADSAVEKAGIKIGDTITHFDGKRIWGLYDFFRKGYALKPGDKVDLKVDRGGKSQTISVTVGKR